jgi:senataxin
MAELIPQLVELRNLPSETHLLCPRTTTHDRDRYDEDIQRVPLSQIAVDQQTLGDSETGKLEEKLAVKRQKIKDARERRSKFIGCLQLLAYDGNETEKYQRMIWEALDETLGRCDICIRNYYVEKMHFLAKLREEYEEPDVQQFFQLIDRRDIARVIYGLDAATSTLAPLPENKRGVNALQTNHLHALFEALLCDAFLQKEDLVVKHFDEPFRLIQSKKQLKINEILPATVRFLFSTNRKRLSWATATWARLNKEPSDLEWSWSIKDQLEARLSQAVDSPSITRFWSATLIITKTLTESMISQKLLDIRPNLRMAMLDHLRFRQGTAAVPFITQTLAVVLSKSPDAFWQSLEVSAPQIVETIFASPLFDKCLEDSASPDNLGELDVLQWVLPLLKSLDIGNQPNACNRLLDELLSTKLLNFKVSKAAKALCFEAGAKAIAHTTQTFATRNQNQNDRPTERIVLKSVMEMVGRHIEVLLDPAKGGLPERKDIARPSVLVLVKNAIALECQCLKNDFEVLSAKEGRDGSKPAALNHDPDCYTPRVWNAVNDSLDKDDTALSKHFVWGIMALPGLETFRGKFEQLPKKKEIFNETFVKISDAVGRALSKLADFPPEHLDALYMQQETNMTLVGALFSAHEDTHDVALTLVKTISGESDRNGALTHLVDAFFGATIYSFCWSLRRIATMRTFGPIPTLVKLCKDILTILTSSGDGKLRYRKATQSDANPVSNYWSYQWIILRTIFEKMESWSYDVHNKELMTEVCRDTMQFAGALFEQYHTFVKFLVDAEPGSKSAKSIPLALLEPPQVMPPTEQSKGSSKGSPVKALGPMSKWLRLRDVYLAENQVILITNMLNQLKVHGMSAEIDGLRYVQEVATTNNIKTILTEQQKAILVRALENYTGKQLSRPIKKKQTTLQLQQWADSAGEQRSRTSAPGSRKDSADEFEDIPEDDWKQLASNYSRVKTERPSTLTSRVGPSLSTQAQPQRKPDLLISKTAAKAKQQDSGKAFIENRKREEAARKARDREAALRARGTTVLGEGLGVLGKEHKIPTEANMMVSSDESSDDSDEELFGGKVQRLPAGNRPAASTAQNAGPVRKIKQVRSQKDIRARLAPDLSGLHKTILSWDFFADTDLPPNSDKKDYTLVTNEFRSVQEYQRTFEPLLILEGWQGFRSAREDGNFRAYEIKIATSMLVDSFFEVTVTMSQKDGQELGWRTTDIVLLSKSNQPTSDSHAPHCLARIKEVGRKKGDFQIVLRLNAANNPLRAHMAEKSTIWGAQILSLTTLEREYGALTALPYYDLSDEIVAAKPSKLLEYTEQELSKFVRVYDVNVAQAKAVKSALDNDAFTLIQGPPGSGKTKTICALVGAAMTGFLGNQPKPAPRLNGPIAPSAAPKAAKKILVCAPSNAAVDELVMRFKTGLKMTDGSTEKINVVRLGRSDAINTNVKDVTLDELVNAKLDLTPKGEKEDIHPVMMEHKQISIQIFELTESISAKRQRQETVHQEENSLGELKKTRQQLSSKIDKLKDKQNSESRTAELTRKRIQQEILDSAHVLCATLSGSGHEVFQGLNVEFETVVIDEAAQSIELSALIPLKYGCNKCILVGDPKQLPPTVLSREAARFQYEQSLFARMEKNHPKSIHLLDTQYRMHPEISQFPSRMFYDSRLKDGPNMAKLRVRPWHHSPILGPYRFFDVQGASHSSVKGRSLVNDAEIRIALALYERLITDVRKYKFRGKIGVITPYKGQLKELKFQFQRRYGEDILSAIEFNTTDAFQGRESEIIIFSCVRASTKGIGFLNDIRRMNVGLTRAKSSLWVLGNSGSLSQGEFWRGLITDAKDRRLYTDGNIEGLLSRPLLTDDMMKDDVEMVDDEVDVTPATSEIDAQTSGSSKGATPAPSRPSSVMSRQSSSSSMPVTSRPDAIRVDSAKSSAKIVVDQKSLASSVDQSPANSIRLQNADSAYGPAGGRFGLNTLANCRICGSDLHFSFNCDNETARASMQGNCRRCFQAGHGIAGCVEPRCLECGEVGHKTEKCAAPTRLRLSKNQRAEVASQEERFKKQREKDIARRAAKQLGEHGSKIPEVRSDRPPPDAPTEPKRKREDSGRSGSSHAAKTPRLEAGVPPRPPSSSINGLQQASVGGSSNPPVRKKKTNQNSMFMKSTR